MEALSRYYDEVPQPLWVVDETGLVQYGNSLFWDYCGRDSTFEETAWHPMVHPEDLPTMIEIWQRAQVTHSPYSLKFRWKHHSGRYQWFRCQAHETRNLYQSKTMWLGCLTNIDEEVILHGQLMAQKEKELTLMKEKLVAESKAESALVSANFKSSFVANMSHDLRTPISAISGLTSLMLMSELTPEQREQAETIAECGRTLVNLVNDVLDLAKLEAGKLEFDSVEFSLRAAQDSVARMAKAYAHASGKTKMNILPKAENLPPYVRGDPRRFEQILINLVTNAIKFTADGGDIEVSFSTREQKETKKVLVRSVVKDNGVGIDDDKLEKLFTPFSQIGGATRGGSIGTGLGLSICKNLVSSMGGTIGVTSRKGVGSEFYFEIPFDRVGMFDPRKENHPSVIQKILTIEERRKQLILLAEDNAVSATIARKMLAKHGYESVTWVANGAEAVERMQTVEKQEARGPFYNTAPYDVILMDCQMPVMNGFQATREIRKIAAGIPIIALTASAHQDDTDRCIDSGMDFVVLKPFDPVDLVNLLDNLLAS